MTQPTPCEVIILTALPVECKAVFSHLQDLEQIRHPSGTMYHQGTFVGSMRTWRVAVAEIGMGDGTAESETEKALSFLHPHMALFVGVAGGIKDVQRGDVVVATKIYAYESGKAGERFEPRPELEHPSHPLEQQARSEAQLDEWRTRLESSSSASLPQVFLGPIAAGEKVLASKQSELFRLLKATYGDALAVEMEGYGFLRAVRKHQKLVHGLVVRGISDLIDDKTEADASGAQEIAAQHAAAFAFQVLASFTLPSGLKPSSLLNLPFDRNPFFTGRETELQDLHRRLNQNQSAAIGQKSAVSGLGGIGKTQLAVEYAYRYHEEYQYVLWARADSVESLNASYTEFATLLELPEKQEQEQEIIIQAVKRWLHKEQRWLLLLDNADTPSLLPDFLPSTVGGHLLITTRAADVSAQIAGVGHSLEVESFSDEQGALFLLHRSGQLDTSTTFDQAEEKIRRLALQISHELGGLPLALDQAGAYLKATGANLAVYQQLYEKHRTQLLKERRSADYRESVATTWDISFRKVEQQNPAAANLLHFCAFLAPDAIPEEILSKGAKELGERLSPVAVDPFLLNQAIESLHAYSLIGREAKTLTLSVHRLVQAVVRESLSVEVQQQWMRRATEALNVAFPEGELSTWSQHERLLPHALLCATWIERIHLTSPEASRLLHNVGYYLKVRARYREAEPLYLQALTIRKQYPENSYPDVVASLTNLAELYRAQGKYVEAEPLFRQALTISEEHLGDHPYTATSLSNLAELYHDQGNYAKVKEPLLRALAICERLYGDSDPSIVTSLNNLAELYREQGLYTEAEPLLQRALAICEQHFGNMHSLTATCLINLANLYHNQGKFAEAEPLYQRGLAICERLYGESHPSIATGLNNLAKLYREQGLYTEAEPLLQRALAIYEQLLGSSHPYTAISLNNLARLYNAQGKDTQAEPLFQGALHILEQSLGPDHPHTRTVRRSYADFLRSLGRDTEAEALESEANG